MFSVKQREMIARARENPLRELGSIVLSGMTLGVQCFIVFGMIKLCIDNYGAEFLSNIIVPFFVVVLLIILGLGVVFLCCVYWIVNHEDEIEYGED